MPRKSYSGSTCPAPNASVDPATKLSEVERMVRPRERRIEMEWIKTSERLPPEWEDVLGFRDDHCAICYRYHHNSGVDGWSTNGKAGLIVPPPSHWMPLPEPPAV